MRPHRRPAQQSGAEEVHRRARALDGRISIGTVYRTAGLFEELGILKRRDFGDGRARYEMAGRERHHHLVDMDTRRVVEFRSEELERLAREIAAGLGSDLAGYRLVLSGRSRPGLDCKSSAPPAPRKRRSGNDDQMGFSNRSDRRKGADACLPVPPAATADLRLARSGPRSPQAAPRPCVTAARSGPARSR